MCESLATTLAALHSVKPADVGLDGYGRPSGYSRRQVRGCDGCFVRVNAARRCIRRWSCPAPADAGQHAGLEAPECRDHRGVDT